MATYNKSHDKNAVQFDALSQIAFDVVGAVAASTAISSIAAALPLALDTKIYHVAATYTAVSGSPAIQIIYGGAAASAGVGTPDTNATNGISVFAAPISLTAAANTTQLVYVPSPNSDVIYPESGAPLTLRVLTGAGDTASNLKVTLGTKVIDQHADATMLPTPLGNYGFDSSIF